ncbi:unnamed protein product [Diatraea saccharalis]|uniref:Uncharacterized protein n=1 Tax=Diatraea saccharalis TaxID=40085 RepID=A0A9N9RH86_9NEOP|nr:unnamed protein product [Diatraea saccharalis]
MANIKIVIFVAIFCVVCGKPLEYSENDDPTTNHEKSHTIQRRFVNTALTSGGFDNDEFNRMRVKRSEEYDDCEKLQLCKLHAHSRHSFLAAFELYFVNKENARLWDHHARSSKDCERRFSCYKK